MKFIYFLQTCKGLTLMLMLLTINICNVNSPLELRPVDSVAVVVGAAAYDQTVHEGPCKYWFSNILI